MQGLSQLSDAKRVLFDRYSKGRVSSGHKIGRRPQGIPAPLSLVQEQLYFRELQFAGNPPLYNECVTVRMLGALDADVLERSFNEIIRRHELWRTSFETKAGQPVQIVHPHRPMQFSRIDLRGLGEAERETEAVRLVSEDVRRPFRLDRDPLLRPTLVRMNDEDHRLFLAVHQIVVDGRSAYQIYPSELAAHYKAFLEGQTSPLPELKIQCADFAWWQREHLKGEEARQVSYWREQLGSNLPVSGWPTEKPNSTVRSCSGRIHPFAFSPQLSAHVRDMSKRLNGTLFLVLLTGLASVIHRYEKHRYGEGGDVVLGTLSPSGRKQSEVMDLLGYFLNPVALRLNCGAHTMFGELLHHARGVVSDAISNDDVPIERLARALEGQDGSGPNPFFNIAVSLQPPTSDLGLPWSVTSMDVESGGSPWPLYLAFIDRPEGIIGRAQFNPELFEIGTIKRLLQDLQLLFETICL
jgi:surfactin family lipopeptide synthetase A